MSFPFFDCPTCETMRLTFADLDGDVICRRCLHCDHSASEDQIVWFDAAMADEAGYDIEGEKRESGKRGCRDGQCGVQQPDSP